MNSVTNAVISLIDSGGHGCHGESARRVDFDNFTRWITKTALKIEKIHPQANADDNVAREGQALLRLQELLLETRAATEG